MTAHVKFSYEEVQRVRCGFCGASIGDPCRSRNGRRLADGHEHAGRVGLYRWRKEHGGTFVRKETGQ